MREIIPKYLKNLEALGIDIKKLRFLKRKELIQKFGEEKFKVLETIGKTIREGRWKVEVKVDHTLNAFLDEFGDVKLFPEEAKRILSRETADSLTLHYLKRRFIDGWNLKSPKELDEMMTKYLKKINSVVYPQGNRYVLYYPPDRMVTVIEIPNYRISLYRLKDIYEDYEDYIEQVGGVIFKSWQLEQLLKKLT